MKSILVFLFLFIQIYVLYGQRNNIWMIGGEFPNHNCGIDFTNGIPDTFTVYRDLGFFITNAGICDTSGQLLFYTNGDYIANRQHGRLLNTTNYNPTLTGDTTYGLNGCQAAVIIPRPGNTSQYFIFHVNGEYFNANNQFELQPLELRYSHVDITLDNGLGGIVAGEKAVSIINDTLTWGRLTACKHANGRDWWVIMHRYYSDLYYKVLVTPDTLQVFQQNIGHVITSDVGGQAVFSPAGDKFCMLSDNNYVDIFHFDRCTGMFYIIDNFNISVPAATYGCSFSPNGKYLYINTNLQVFQFDTDDIPVSQSLDTVAWWDTTYSPLATIFFMQNIAPDNKIYITTFQGTDKLHVIDSPDLAGLNCNLIQNAVTLPSLNVLSLPNAVNYDLGPVHGSVCDTLSTGIDNYDFERSLSVFPNPSTNYITITYDLPSHQSAEFILTDMKGAIILQRPLYGSFKSLFVSTAQYPAGTYFYEVRYGKDHYKKYGKLIILK